jgi:hypothetical protein
MQAGFLAQDPGQQEDRGRRYLAYFWAQVPALLKTDLPSEAHRWWEEMYEAHSDLLGFDRKGNVRNWWGGNISDLFARLNLKDTYDQDYRSLSQMAHGTSQGILLTERERRLEIRSNRLIPEILVFGVRYVLGIAGLWNDCFGIMEKRSIDALAEEAVNFKFR